MVLPGSCPAAAWSWTAGRSVSGLLRAGRHQVEHDVEPLPGRRLQERGGGVVDDPVRAVGADPVGAARAAGRGHGGTGLPGELDGVPARLARQAISGRTGAPQLWCILDEGVLHRAIGGSKVMRSQLYRLAEVAEHPKTTIHVIRSGGAHAGLLAHFVIGRE